MRGEGRQTLLYDLDGDGKADIVYKNTSGNVKYSLQGSSSGSSEIPIAGYPANTNPEALGDMFKGVLDNVRIYNRALSESEIQILYNEGN